MLASILVFLIPVSLGFIYVNLTENYLIKDVFLVVMGMWFSLNIMKSYLFGEYIIGYAVSLPNEKKYFALRVIMFILSIVLAAAIINKYFVSLL